MKKLFAVSLVAMIFFVTSCKKNLTPANTTCPYLSSSIVAPASEQQALKDSLTAYGIVATKDSAGFYYTINQPGTAVNDTSLCTTVAAFYRGGFFNGKGFDSSATGNPLIFQLYQVIPAWQKGIPLAGKGGNINIYVPPSLGYGAKDVTDPSTGKVVIPANSYLVFQVSVADVQ
ncbi:MAG TPA: FKBP-type peptidyl-prolyl cis-trans isomerase [Hanamia sp.]|jgi:FKBP-type peptidyl-prolyl cis-trans isomerase FkpA|nr:FKBP-type peptidyl-prolyl cis-trans isomerase [Hanamia sp.]